MNAKANDSNVRKAVLSLDAANTITLLYCLSPYSLLALSKSSFVMTLLYLRCLRLAFAASARH
jgi:hypothetical protein